MVEMMYDSRSAPLTPIVGVTGPDRGGFAAWAFTAIAVRRAGGTPRRITPRRASPIEELDALILGGGADVSPELYGAEHEPFLPRHKPRDERWSQYLLDLVLTPVTMMSRKLAGLFTAAYLDRSRDELELSLLSDALQHGKPVLGICRGEQLMNVFFGGTLRQNLTGLYVEDPEVRTFLPRKRIQIAPDSNLARVMGKEVERVNALHRQGVERLGHQLRVVARDRNGIVQGIEHPDLPFVIGVQWHPEYLPQVSSQARLFSQLIHHATQRGTRSAIGPQEAEARRERALHDIGVSASRRSA